jgi:hypothetical protein
MVEAIGADGWMGLRPGVGPPTICADHSKPPRWSLSALPLRLREKVIGKGVGMGMASFTPNGGIVGLSSSLTGEEAGESAFEGGIG